MLPESLDETYERILKAINKANQRHAHRLLQCLTVAIRPLRVEELAEVLAVNVNAEGIPELNADWRWENQEEAILSACSSLVSIITDNGSRVVQFSHFSVKEFLTSDRLASSTEEVSQFYIPVEPSHVILAQACLSVLLSLDHHMDYASSKKIPLVRYAAEHWVKHAEVGNVELHMKDTLDYFFSTEKPHFSVWVQIQDVDKILRFYMSSPPDGVSTSAFPLYFAAKRGFCGLVERLIAKHPEHVNHWCGDYGSPLHASVLGGHIEVSQLLVACGADINSHFEMQDNWTPLHIASREGHLKIVKWLLDCGADANFKTNLGCTPPHFAAAFGHLDIARILLGHNAGVNSQDDENGSSLLVLHRAFGGPGNQVAIM